MSATFPIDFPPASPVGVVEAARDVLGELEAVLWSAKSPRELLGVNGALELLRSRLAATQMVVAAEIEATDAAKTEEQWGSTKDYLTETAGGRRGAGGRLLRTGRALTGDRAATLAALHAGEISPEHAEVIVKVIDQLPVDAEIRAAAEALLLAEAQHLNATELRIAGEHLLEVLDPDGVARREEKNLDKNERSAHLQRFLAIVDDGLGGVRLRGRGTVEDAAVIKSALAALSAPQPGTDPDEGTEGRDLRDHGARTWDALVETCQKAHDTDVLPTAHGAKTRVMVLIDHDALVAGVGAATLDTGDRLSAAAVRKLACDAEIIVRAPVGGRVGQRWGNRAASKRGVAAEPTRQAQRPGRHRRPGRQAGADSTHHITHWANGGPTSLDNMVMLCRAHHTVLHTTPWQVRINPGDGRPEFKPPPLGRRLRTAFRERHDERDHWIRERTPRE